MFQDWPTRQHRSPAGPGWQHEIKYDGYRIIARRDADRVRLWSRTGIDWADRLPAAIEVGAAIKTPSAILSGLFEIQARVQDTRNFR